MQQAKKRVGTHCRARVFSTHLRNALHVPSVGRLSDFPALATARQLRIMWSTRLPPARRWRPAVLAFWPVPHRCLLSLPRVSCVATPQVPLRHGLRTVQLPQETRSYIRFVCYCRHTTGTWFRAVAVRNSVQLHARTERTTCCCITFLSSVRAASATFQLLPLTPGHRSGASASTAIAAALLGTSRLRCTFPRPWHSASACSQSRLANCRSTFCRLPCPP